MKKKRLVFISLLGLTSVNSPGSTTSKNTQARAGFEVARCLFVFSHFNLFLCVKQELLSGGYKGVNANSASYHKPIVKTV